MSISYSSLEHLQESSPSRGSISFDQEMMLREYFVAHIQHAGARLELPAVCVGTACTYLHRFYSIVDFFEFDPFVVARTCVFLASKAEEKSKRVRDVVNVCYRLHHPTKEAIQVSKEFWTLKNETLDMEKILLRVLGFELEEEQPHQYILHIVQELEAPEEVAVAAWNVMNDSLRTPLCLQYRPEAVSCAALYIAGELLSMQVNREPSWWESFGIKDMEMEDMCAQILKLYETCDIKETENDKAMKPSSHSSSSVASSSSSSTALHLSQQPQGRRASVPSSSSTSSSSSSSLSVPLMGHSSSSSSSSASSLGLSISTAPSSSFSAAVTSPKMRPSTSPRGLSFSRVLTYPTSMSKEDHGIVGMYSLVSVMWSSFSICVSDFLSHSLFSFFLPPPLSLSHPSSLTLLFSILLPLPTPTLSLSSLLPSTASIIKSFKHGRKPNLPVQNGSSKPLST